MQRPFAPRHFVGLALISSMACLGLVACGGASRTSSAIVVPQPIRLVLADSALRENAAGTTPRVLNSSAVPGFKREQWSLGRIAGVVSDAAAEEFGLTTISDAESEDTPSTGDLALRNA